MIYDKEISYARAQRERYKNVAFSDGPSSYRESSNYDLLYILGDFKRGGVYHIADLACGSGLVGIEVARRIRRYKGSVRITFIDIVSENLNKIRKGPNRKTGLADLRSIKAKDGEFSHTYCRYAIKNMQYDDQILSLKEICRVTDEIFILQDMYSPLWLKEFQNNERWAKNLAAGDRITKNNVPTETEWKKMHEKAGFKIEKIERRRYKAHTSDWVKSNQIATQNLRIYFDFLERAKKKWPRSWEDYEIKKYRSGYELTYPVIFLKCKRR
jgi:ubiquinone/menaquinone biosynthesis C-methylase UbiE